MDQCLVFSSRKRVLEDTYITRVGTGIPLLTNSGSCLGVYEFEPEPNLNVVSTLGIIWEPSSLDGVKRNGEWLSHWVGEHHFLLLILGLTSSQVNLLILPVVSILHNHKLVEAFDEV